MFQLPEASLCKADKDFELQCKVIPEKFDQLLQTLGQEDINLLQAEYDEEEVVVSILFHSTILHSARII